MEERCEGAKMVRSCQSLVSLDKNRHETKAVRKGKKMFYGFKNVSVLRALSRIDC